MVGVSSTKLICWSSSIAIKCRERVAPDGGGFFVQLYLVHLAFPILLLLFFFKVS